MSDFQFYLSLFIRRLPVFLPIASAIAAISLIVAVALPPAFESSAELVVESPQIPDELAPSTVRLPPLEHLQIISQRLLTRANLLRIARQQNVFPDIATMSPDAIDEAMRAHTTIRTKSNRGEATFMTITFEAPSARAAAAVVGEYMTLIQQEDARFRQGRAGETLDFFEQQVEQLAVDLEEASAEILAFKEANSDALPETLDLRVSQRAEAQNKLERIDREASVLKDQRARLLAIYEATGGGTLGGDPVQQAMDQLRLDQFRTQLEEARRTSAADSPKVKLLEAQIAQLEQKVSLGQGGGDDAENATRELPLTLRFELEDIDAGLTEHVAERASVEARLADLTASIDRTPAVSIQLEELQRQYDTVRSRYAGAQDRLSAARTGELIETRSRGQEITIIDPPAVPTEPSKPNRLMIGVGGVALGIVAGLAVLILLEVLNRTARRPEDLVKRFDIMPLATIPVVQTPGEVVGRRFWRVAVIVLLGVGVPALVLAVHTYYLPLDLLAERLMNKIGVRL